MKAFLLSIHVLASIIFIGPVTVATSLFPRYARAAVDGSDRARGVLDLLHRISRSYAVLGVSVPVFGIAVGAALGVLLQSWLVVSMALTAVAAGLLALVLLPGQAAVVDLLDGGGDPSPVLARMSMVAGLFALTWAVVVVLMIIRPGSTTGVAH
ncbi:hypothetical protein [Pseudonocardia spinosispora]|uniref:hypothetical protein n=1 Tax=Pseudonocardia spinosispora TaxID=103441 RepID=UPI0003FC84EC|nr:hypothetical protein [Pseudonocardia spinosispora]